MISPSPITSTSVAVNSPRRSSLVGLIGAGIQTSRAPSMHQHEVRFHGMHYVYRLIVLEELGVGPEALETLLREAEHIGFDGLNITHPCKQLVLPLITSLFESAVAIGAVNTVVPRNGEGIGHNTEGWGSGKAFESSSPDVAKDPVLES